MLQENVNREKFLFVFVNIPAPALGNASQVTKHVAKREFERPYKGYP
jgi:hypothetical protein